MYIDKDSTPVVVIGEGIRVRGDIHIPAGSRLTDALNTKAYAFLAITDAVVTRLQDDVEIYRSPYLALNRDAVVCLMPVEER